MFLSSLPRRSLEVCVPLTVSPGTTTPSVSYHFICGSNVHLFVHFELMQWLCQCGSNIIPGYMCATFRAEHLYMDNSHWKNYHWSYHSNNKLMMLSSEDTVAQASICSIHTHILNLTFCITFCIGKLLHSVLFSIELQHCTQICFVKNLSMSLEVFLTQLCKFLLVFF